MDRDGAPAWPAAVGGAPDKAAFRRMVERHWVELHRRYYPTLGSTRRRNIVVFGGRNPVEKPAGCRTG